MHTLQIFQSHDQMKWDHLQPDTMQWVMHDDVLRTQKLTWVSQPFVVLQYVHCFSLGQIQEYFH